jgi:hypothetical protein
MAMLDHYNERRTPQERRLAVVPNGLLRWMPQRFQLEQVGAGAVADVPPASLRPRGVRGHLRLVMPLAPEFEPGALCMHTDDEVVRFDSYDPAGALACKGCVDSTEYLGDALLHDPRYGVWGANGQPRHAA